MSTTNQDDSRSPNPRLARYLHRIQQLMGPRSRSTSPISSRISKSIRPNSLDHYLKYQLTFKILCSFFDKRNKTFMRHFFNNLRVSEKTKVQKIYKFVSIEKTTCAHMTVDSGISAKMLFNLLKLKMKSNLNIAFTAIKENNKSNSFIDTIKSARSHQTKIYQNLFRQAQIKEMLGVTLSKLYYKKLNFVFNQLKLNKYRKQQKQMKIDKGKEIKQYRYIKFLQISTLIRIFNKIKQRSLKYSMQSMNNYLIKYKQKNNKLKVEQFIYQQKLKNFTNLMILNFKHKIFLEIKELKKVCEIKNIQYRQNKKNQQNRKATYMYIIGIFNATNIINKIFDNKNFENNLLFMKKIKNILNLKIQGLDILYKVLNKNIAIKLSSSFTYLMSCKIEDNKQSIEQKVQIQSNKILKKHNYNWKALSNLFNIDKYLIYYMKQPFDNIKNQKGKRNLQTNFKITQTVEQSSQFKSFEQESYFQLKNKLILKQKQIFPKVLYKYFFLQLAESFVKLKYTDSKGAKSPTDDIRKTDWSNDLQTFLQQRSRFSNLFINKFNKIEQLINESKNGNLATPISRQSKITISPKNSNRKTVNFAQ